MSIQIKYTDELSNFISTQQLDQVDSYNKYVYENGEIRKIEKYDKTRVARNLNPLWGGEYFMQPEEDLATLVQEYVMIPQHAAWGFYYNKQEVLGGEYTLWDYEDFVNDTQAMRKGKILFNDKMWDVGIWLYDMVSGDFLGGSKVYYARIPNNLSNDEDYRFSLDYKADGSLESGNDVHDDMNLRWKADVSPELFINALRAFRDKFADLDYLYGFDWDAKTWYHHAFPIIPEPGTI